MGSSSKSSNSKKSELSSHDLLLRQRLHEALSLGIRSYDTKEKKWQCKDAEIQSHVLRAMTAFIDCISSSLLRHPFIKDSISDMLVAMEGILWCENERVLTPATIVSVKLVGCMGTSIHNYNVSGLIISLSNLLSIHPLSVAVSSAVALNHIFTNHMRYGNQKELWEVVVKTNIVENVVRAIEDYEDGTQPCRYFIEMISLLKTILWRWPPFRYHVWSNSRLMFKLGDSFINSDASISVSVLQLYSALALCGEGAMRLLESEEPLLKMVQCMAPSQPNNVRHEALILCQHLARSAKTCSILTSVHGEPIVEGIVSSMGGWRSYSKKLPSDHMLLVKEACRTALITRWAGHHHSYFWDLQIDKLLLEILVGSCSSISETESIPSILPLVNNTNEDTRCYIWDILGWLAVHCEEDFLPKITGNFFCLDNLICCVFAVAEDLMHKERRSLCPELEHVSRAVLLMIFSPCKYISSHARNYLPCMLASFGASSYLNSLLATLRFHVTGGGSFIFDKQLTLIYLKFLAFYSILPQYQNVIISRKGIQIFSAIIKRCIHSDVHIKRFSITSPLHNIPERRTCCWNDDDDWEGGDILLLYSLLVLSQLILSCGGVCGHHKETSRKIAGCMSCENSEVHGLVDDLVYVMSNNFSAGAKWYAAYVLGFFGFFGFPSKLGGRMKRALDADEITDLQLLVSNGQTISVHGAILVARCPFLLPPKEFLKERARDVGSTNEGETEQYRGLRSKIRMSDRVDGSALVKILEYIYTGIFHVDNDLMKPLKLIAKPCGLKSLADMLHRKPPIWGTPTIIYDLRGALEPSGYLFFDIILEAKSTGVTSDCTVCQLPKPHMHAHKIVLWSMCDYLQALFRSGMHDSYSQVIKVPIGWNALTKLVDWFYSGELPVINPGCIWSNMESAHQLHEMQAYVELSSLAEYWCLEEVGEASMNAFISHLKSSEKISVEIIQFAANLNQGKLVKAAIEIIGPLYPKIRRSGDLEHLDEEIVAMLNAEYVRHCQVSDD